METNTQTNEEVMETAANASDGKKKFGKKKLALIIIIAALAVAGVVGAANADRVGNFFRSKFSSPEKYYRYVEKKNRDEAVSAFSKKYDAVLDNLTVKDEQKKAVIKVEAGDALKPMLSSIGLESLEIESNAKMKDKVMTGKAVIRANGKDALSYTTYLDYASGKMYMQIPELSKTYLDYSTIFTQSGMDTGKLYDVAQNSSKYLPSAKAVEETLTKYSDIVYDNVSKVKRDTKTVKVDGIEGKYTRLKVSSDTDAQFDTVADVVDALNKDKNIEKTLKNIDDSLYTEFKSAIEETKSEVDTLKKSDNSDDGEDALDLRMELYVDNSGNIVGRTMDVTVGSNNMSLSVMSPRKGNQFAQEITFEVDGVTYVTLTGKGSVKSGKINATYHLNTDTSLNDEDSLAIFGDDMLVIEIKDLDEKALDDGECQGEIVLSNKTVEGADLYSVKCTLDNKKDQADTKIELLSGKASMLTVAIQSGEGEDPKVEAPAADASICNFADEDAITQYVSQLDLITFINNLKDTCGVDLSRYLMGAMGGTDEYTFDGTTDDAYGDASDESADVYDGLTPEELNELYFSTDNN